jgi:ribosomal protein S18 acetylase RimI-like enzyme
VRARAVEWVLIHRLTDKSEIRARLDNDREWCLYALADLDDGMFEHCDWWVHEDGLALVFRALDIRPILIAAGVPNSAREIFMRLEEASGYLNLKPELLDCATGIYCYRKCNRMNRMIMDAFRPRVGKTEVLSMTDQRDIESLYATGDGGGIAFAPFQLDSGFFRGVRVNGELVSVAGVHVVSRNESVAGVGNIFTRPDYRGRGLAQIVTSAVVTALQDAGIRTIGLNVEHTNTAAIQAYERLGFSTRFSYFEGVADRITAASPP